MINVACFCGCLYSFDGGQGPCPKCGTVAVVSTTAIHQTSLNIDDPDETTTEPAGALVATGPEA